MLLDEFPNLDGRVYPTISRRFVAVLVDGAIFMPVSILLSYIDSLGRLNAIFTSTIMGLIGFSYHMFFLTRFGATPGKMLLKIKVVTINGNEIGVKEAFLRIIIFIVTAIINLIVTAYIHLFITGQQFQTMTNLEKYKWFMANSPVLARVWLFLSNVCHLSDIIAIFCNKRKRALHDYIAGTVVIKSKYEEYAKQYSQKIEEFYGPVTTTPNANLTGENK